MKKYKFLLIISFTLFLSVFSVAFSSYAAETVKYLAYENGNFVEKTCENYKYYHNEEISGSYGPGVYVFDNCSAEFSVRFIGDVTIILKNGSDNYFESGIEINPGTSFSVYAEIEEQGKSVGKLRTGSSGGAGIGGSELKFDDNSLSCGNVYIHGGELEINGAPNCAGIGSSFIPKEVGKAGNVYIYGGKVTAKGGVHAAGIGGGSCEDKGGNGGNVYVYGGEVHAYGGAAAAGIGGGTKSKDNLIFSDVGDGGNGGYFEIHGGVVNAYGGGNSTESGKDENKGGGAGIGGGQWGKGGTVKIIGGEVKAFGGYYGAGIGGGSGCTGSVVTIKGGKVTAEGGENAAGIGGGNNGHGETVHVKGGSVTAKGGKNGAGIGGGNNNSAGHFRIDSGSVDAIGGWYGAGIGGGYQGDGAEVEIYGGYVYADGNMCAAGIGGGYEGDGDTVSIYGGTIEISSGSKAEAIGKGLDGDDSGDIIISNDVCPYDVYSKSMLTILNPNNYFHVDNNFYIEFIPLKTEIYYTYDVNNATAVENKVKACSLLPNIKTLGNLWVIVDKDLTIDSLQIKGNVNLILKNNCTLTVKGGVDVTSGNTLKIYSQSTKISEMGMLKATGQSHAGIGSGDNTTSGTIAIFGGKIEARGGFLASGIGGGEKGNGAQVSIEGTCSVHAISGGSELAIGGGDKAESDGKFTISGGLMFTNNLTGKISSLGEFFQEKEVSFNAEFLPVEYIVPGKNTPSYCGNYRHFDPYDNSVIRGGWYVSEQEDFMLFVNRSGETAPIVIDGDVHFILKNNTKISITGIKINPGASLTIYGQSEDPEKMGVLVTDGTYKECDGICYLGSDNATKLVINGGHVKSTGDSNCAGIGCNVTVNGGLVEANGGTLGAGIGGGFSEGGVAFTINDGVVHATGGSQAAGIGGGARGIGGTFNINGGTVYANAGSDKLNGIGAGKEIFEGVPLDPGIINVSDEVLLFDLNENKPIEVSFTDYDWMPLLCKGNVAFTTERLNAAYLEYTYSSVNGSLSAGQIIPKGFKIIHKDSTNLTTGTYVVKFSGEIDEPIKISGDVKLVLLDGVKLKANKGIIVEGDNKLSIYGQSTENLKTGVLIANSNRDLYAGIGSGSNKASGNIYIHGGHIESYGGLQAAGIGGGSESAGKVTVYSGFVFGYGGNAKDISKVSPSSTGGGAGVGGGFDALGNVNIYGGSVYGRGGKGGGAGIGGSVGIFSGCNVFIDGEAKIYAYGGDGLFKSVDSFEINRMIKAGPGIGAGDNSFISVVEIRDGNIIAKSGENAYQGLLPNTDAVNAKQVIINPHEFYGIKLTSESSKDSIIYVVNTENAKADFAGKTSVNLESFYNSNIYDDPFDHKTGDSNTIFVWSFVMILSLIALSCCMVVRRREE